MRAHVLLFLLLTAACSSPRVAVPPEKAAELAPTIANIEKYLQSQPDNLPVTYLAAAMHSQAGKTAEALRYLEELRRRGWTLGVADSDFRDALSERQIRNAIAALQKLARKEGKPVVAFTLRDDAFMPEGIAYDSASDRFFVGSILRRKIVTIDRRGMVRDFTPSDAGLAAVLGIRVDRANRVLWAASSGEKNVPGLSAPERDRSLLFGFDLASGELKHKLALPGEGRQQLNDICVMRDGTLYATDSAAGAVYHLAAAGSQVELFVERGKLPYVNGIACDDERQRLYVGQFGGVSSVDLRTKEVTRVDGPTGAITGGLDGLYLHRNALIGMQNTFGSGRVIRMPLDDAGDTITKVDALAAGDPRFHLPTTGTVVGNEFFFIANSQLRMFDDDGKPYEKRRQRPIIMRVPLP